MDGKQFNGDGGDGSVALLWAGHGDGGQEVGTAEITYQYRTYLPRCETYAIRLWGSRVTGIYGPLEYNEVLFSALPGFPYSDREEDVSWIDSKWAEFVPCETEHEEGTIRI